MLVYIIMLIRLVIIILFNDVFDVHKKNKKTLNQAIVATFDFLNSSIYNFQIRNKKIWKTTGQERYIEI